MTTSKNTYTQRCTRCNGKGRRVRRSGEVVTCDVCEGVGEQLFEEGSLSLLIGEMRTKAKLYQQEGRDLAVAKDLVDWADKLDTIRRVDNYKAGYACGWSDLEHGYTFDDSFGRKLVVKGH